MMENMNIGWLLTKGIPLFEMQTNLCLNNKLYYGQITKRSKITDKERKFVFKVRSLDVAHQSFILNQTKLVQIKKNYLAIDF